MVKNTTKINLPHGLTMSIESDDPTTDAAGVPDTTVDSGANVMECQDNAELPEDNASAEYDAAAAETKTDDVTDVAKANESTFFGLTLYKRATEGFGVKSAFKQLRVASVDELLQNPKLKSAIDEAKAWAEKHHVHCATKDEVQKNKQTLGTRLFSNAGKNASTTNDRFDKSLQKVDKMYKPLNYFVIKAFNGVIIGYNTYNKASSITGGKDMVTIYVFFTKNNGKVFAKKLVSAEIQKTYAEESAGIFSKFLAAESDDPAPVSTEPKSDNAPAADPTTSDTPVTPADANPDAAADAAGDHAEPDEDDVDIDVGTEVSENPDAAADAAGDHAEPDDDNKPAGDEPKDDDQKAVESFFKKWGIK